MYCDVMTSLMSSIAILLSFYIIYLSKTREYEVEELEKNHSQKLEEIQEFMIEKYKEKIEDENDILDGMAEQFEQFGNEINKLKINLNDVNDLVKLNIEEMENQIQKANKKIHEKEIIISKQIRKIKRLKNDSVGR